MRDTLESAGRAGSEAEETLWLVLRHRRLDRGCHREHMWDPDRSWRADFAWPKARLIVEVDGLAGDAPGGIGGHQTADGAGRDRVRDRAAVRAGWRVLRFGSGEVLADPHAVADEIAPWASTVAPGLLSEGMGADR